VGRLNVKTEVSEVSSLDLLLVVAGSVKLLVLGPLVIGLIALAIAFAKPQSFVGLACLANSHDGFALSAWLCH
jgi:hypothetical protein